MSDTDSRTEKCSHVRNSHDSAIPGIGVFDNISIQQEHSKLLMLLWTVRAHKAAKAHYIASLNIKRWGFVLTVFNALSAIVILVLTNAKWQQKIIDKWLSKYYIFSDGDLSVINPHTLVLSIAGIILVLSSIAQFILRWPEQAQKHRFAGIEFSNLQRKIERYTSSVYYNMFMLHTISREYNHITKSYPLVPRATWCRAGGGNPRVWYKPFTWKDGTTLGDIDKYIVELEKHLRAY